MKLPLNEHKELGESLRDARNMLVSISIELDQKYGNSKELGSKLERAVMLIDEVRSLLDDRIFNEYPDIDSEEECGVYF